MNTIYDKILVFSKREHGEVKLTPNFKVREFACQDGTDVVLIHPAIPQICQAVRDNFGKAFSPNSAYRTVSHNSAVGGSKYSLHIYGKAVDIPAIGCTPNELYAFCEEWCGNTCEIGLYSWGVHVGIQFEKERFKGN